MCKMFLNLQQCSGFKGAYYFDGSECVHDDKHGVGYYDAMAVMMSMVMVMMSRWMTVIYIYYDEVSVCHEKSSLPS